MNQPCDCQITDFQERLSKRTSNIRAPFADDPQSNRSWNSNDAKGQRLLFQSLVAVASLCVSIGFIFALFLYRKPVFLLPMIGFVAMAIRFASIALQTVKEDPVKAVYVLSSVLSRFCNDPPVMDPHTKFPQSKKFEEAFETIRNECLQAIHGKRIPDADFAYGSTFVAKTFDTQNETETKKGWRLFPIKMAGQFIPEGQRLCPKTSELVNQPDIVTAHFSVLEGESHIPLHIGYYKGIMRLMLAIKVPEDRENVFLCVHQRKVQWTEGKCVLFDDTFPHEVYNRSKETRIVLYMDVLRPFENPILHWINRFFGKIAANSPSVAKENAKLEQALKLPSLA